MPQIIPCLCTKRQMSTCASGLFTEVVLVRGSNDVGCCAACRRMLTHPGDSTSWRICAFPSAVCTRALVSPHLISWLLHCTQMYVYASGRFKQLARRELEHSRSIQLTMKDSSAGTAVALEAVPGSPPIANGHFHPDGQHFPAHWTPLRQQLIMFRFSYPCPMLAIACPLQQKQRKEFVPSR